ncbi:MAG: hypothetical protein KA477_00025 [Candidatus Levybacteria bacterium]|nr:hypothetical protein [Candidatus Levybacteria bacterium]
MQRKTLSILAIVTCCLIFSEQAMANPFNAIYLRFESIFGNDLTFSLQKGSNVIAGIVLIVMLLIDFVFRKGEHFQGMRYIWIFIGVIGINIGTGIIEYIAGEESGLLDLLKKKK